MVMAAPHAPILPMPNRHKPYPRLQGKLSAAPYDETRNIALCDEDGCGGVSGFWWCGQFLVSVSTSEYEHSECGNSC